MRRRCAALAVLVASLVTACGSAPAETKGPKVEGFSPSSTAAGALPSTTAMPADDATVPAPSLTDPVAPPAADAPATPVTVRYRVEVQVKDVPKAAFASFVATTLADAKSWGQAGYRFVEDPGADFRVVLAEPAGVDKLCLPLKTGGNVSCQNGPVVALNADRWRRATDFWTAGIATYRQYMVNHEVGHLIGMRHPDPACPAKGRPSSVMAQQTKGLAGCAGNAWPLPWELTLARKRPVTLAPLPDWNPGPPPSPPADGIG